MLGSVDKVSKITDLFVEEILKLKNNIA